MSKFLTDLVTRDITDKVFELVEPLVYASDLFGEIYIPVGFQSDGASVPRLPVVYTLWGNRAHREAVLHDASFRIDFPWKLLFNEANKLFFEAMTATGKPFYIRYPMYAAVCALGCGSFHKRKMDDKLY